MFPEQINPVFTWIAGGAFLATTAFITYYMITSTSQHIRVANRMRLALGDERASKRENRLLGRATTIKFAAGKVIAVFGRLMPLGDADRQKIAVNLARAGYRSTGAVATMLGIKFACLLGGLITGLVTATIMLSGALVLFGGLLGGVLIGVLLNIMPEVILGRLAVRRQRRINAGLAEAFDLLVVCLESGLTFDRALSRTVENLQAFQPQLAKEFSQAVLDMNVHGRTREEALSRLADRVDSQNFRDLAITVAQSERHGTPLADALRKLASSVRVDSIARMQEKMARLPTLLILPSIACLLPGIVVIIGGPALLQLTDSLSSFGGG